LCIGSGRRIANELFQLILASQLYWAAVRADTAAIPPPSPSPSRWPKCYHTHSNFTGGNKFSHFGNLS
jgi:hypothetical protein